MPIINHKNYLEIVCKTFTCIVLGKIILEKLVGHVDFYYASNILTILAVTAISTFILGLHYYFREVSVFIVIIIQYILILFFVLGSIWIQGCFVELSKNAYLDMFLSFTVPYVIGAAMYYIAFFNQIKKANQLLKAIKAKTESDI